MATMGLMALGSSAWQHWTIALLKAAYCQGPMAWQLLGLAAPQQAVSSNAFISITLCHTAPISVQPAVNALWLSSCRD